ncbi:unnamed protein product [Pleuronectes platessa]|uniref:Uncharacterized protein n=1 Tax=Pleuronectes platessa TaxID=8262 RepID=A0A9N7VP12_PLEPL|nr:unnamed protein product [Pleuronectes platessa]
MSPEDSRALGVKDAEQFILRPQSSGSEKCTRSGDRNLSIPEMGMCPGKSRQSWTPAKPQHTWTTSPTVKRVFVYSRPLQAPCKPLANRGSLRAFLDQSPPSPPQSLPPHRRHHPTAATTTSRHAWMKPSTWHDGTERETGVGRGGGVTGGEWRRGTRAAIERREKDKGFFFAEDAFKSSVSRSYGYTVSPPLLGARRLHIGSPKTGEAKGISPGQMVWPGQPRPGFPRRKHTGLGAMSVAPRAPRGTR